MPSIREIGNITLFAAAFAASAAALSTLRPLPDSAFLAPKFAYYEKHASEFDVVFVGSSRVLKGFDPASFSKTVASKSGRELRAFNFGIPGMRGHEAARVVEKILELHSDRLRHLFVEFPEFRGTFPDDNWANSERAVWWHDLRSTFEVLATISRSRAPLQEKVSLATQHLRLFAANASNYGAIGAVLDRAFVPHPNDDRIAAEILTRFGFQAIPDDASPQSAVEKSYADPHCRLQEELAPRIARRNKKEGDLAAFNEPALLRQIARVERAGISLHYVAIPSAEATPDAYRAAEARLLPDFMPMNDFSRFPSLWKSPFYSDGAHLKESGAREFSSLLAEEFLSRRDD